MHIGHVEVEGLRINLPPKSQRKDVSRPNNDHHLPSDVSIFVDEMECTDTVLTLGTDKPGKLPPRFVIQSLSLRSIGAGKPMDFTAELTNPKPVGQIESRGSLAPGIPTGLERLRSEAPTPSTMLTSEPSRA